MLWGSYMPVKNKSVSLSVKWLFFILIVLFVVAVRIRLLEFPLERDEGEYAYMGQLILQGIPPYGEAYNMKLPGTALMYALIMSLFGQTIQGIHVGLLLVNCATSFLIFHLVRKIANDFAAAMAGSSYALLSVSPTVLGFAAHATHFVVLPAVSGALLLLHAVKKESLPAYGGAGFLFGLAFVMKQPGVFFFLFGACYIIYRHFSQKPAHTFKKFLANSGVFSLGAAAALIIVAAWVYAAGTFDKFWFWTVTYASQYVSEVQLSAAFDIFLSNFSSVANGFLLIWIFSALGFAVMFFRSDLKGNKVFIVLFVLFSFLTTCPGFYFRQHYFVTFLPAVSILAGIFIDYCNSRFAAFLKSPLAKFTGYGIFLIALLVGCASQTDYFFKDDPVKLCRKIYGANPFPESIEIAKYIEARSLATDRVAVFGSEPQIYFYAKRHSATGYIYTYNLMESHEYSLIMQKEMIKEIESLKPKFIVAVNIDTSWLIRQESEKYIFGWFNDFIREYYSLVGVADIISPDKTVYRWKDDVKNYNVQSGYHLLVFEKAR